MSTFAEKRALKAQIAAAKKAGKSTQTIGRLQYKLNQLTKDSKGTPVKTKVKTKSGVVRQTDTSKKKRVVAKRKEPLTGHPNGGRSTVKITGTNGKSKTVAAGSGKLIDAKQAKTGLHHYVKLSDSKLEFKAKGGDKRAISILKSRRYKG